MRKGARLIAATGLKRFRILSLMNSQPHDNRTAPIAQIRIAAFAGTVHRPAGLQKAGRQQALNAAP